MAVFFLGGRGLGREGGEEKNLGFKSYVILRSRWFRWGINRLSVSPVVLAMGKCILLFGGRGGENPIHVLMWQLEASSNATSSLSLATMEARRLPKK